MMRYISNSGGFNFIEVIISVLILMIGMLGVSALQFIAVKGNAFARDIQNATELAQEFLEQAKTMSYDNSDLSSGSHSDPSNPLTDDVSRFGGKGYNRIWVVTDDSPAINSKTISVTVTWISNNPGITLTGVKWNELAEP